MYQTDHKKRIAEPVDSAILFDLDFYRSVDAYIIAFFSIYWRVSNKSFGVVLFDFYGFLYLPHCRHY